MSCLDLALLLGEKVERVSDTLPQTSTESLFSISGGRVVVTSLSGVVTVTTGATNTTGNVLVNPTGAVASYNIRTGPGLDSRDAGWITSLSNISSDWGSGAFGEIGRSLIVPEGTIDLQTGGSTTGEMSWTLTYVALDEGATVTAA